MENGIEQPKYIRDLFEDDFIKNLLEDIINLSKEKEQLNSFLNQYYQSRKEQINSFEDDKEIPFISDLPYMFTEFDTNSDKLSIKEFKQKIFSFNHSDLLIRYYQAIENLKKSMRIVNPEYLKYGVQEIITSLMKMTKKDINNKYFFTPEYSLSERQIINITLFDFFINLNNWLEFYTKKSQSINKILYENSIKIITSEYNKDIEQKLNQNILDEIVYKFETQVPNIKNAKYNDLARKYKYLKIYAKVIKSDKLWEFSNYELTLYLMNEFDLDDTDELFNIIINNKEQFKDKTQLEIINHLLGCLYGTNYTDNSLSTVISRADKKYLPINNNSIKNQIIEIDKLIVESSHKIYELKRYQESAKLISCRCNKFINSMNNKLSNFYCGINNT